MKAAVSLERSGGAGRGRICLPPPASCLFTPYFPREGESRAGLKFSFDFRGKSDPSPATAAIRSLGAAKLIKSLTANEFAVARADISGALFAPFAPLPRSSGRPLGSLDPQASVFFFLFFFPDISVVHDP